jgi:acyl carrier protein
MEINSIENKIKNEILSLSKKSAAKNEINDETSLIHDLGFDSVLIVQLMLKLEGIFKIIFEDEDIKPDTFVFYKNIRDLIFSKVD